MYGVSDVLILWRLYTKKYPNRRSPLTKAERKALLDELDEMIRLHEKAVADREKALR